MMLLSFTFLVVVGICLPQEDALLSSQLSLLSSKVGTNTNTNKSLTTMTMSLTMRHSSHHPTTTTHTSNTKTTPNKRTSLLVDFSKASCKDATSILDRDGVLAQTDVCTSLHSVRLHSNSSLHQSSRHSTTTTTTTRRRRRVSLSAAPSLFPQTPPPPPNRGLNRSLSGTRLLFDRDCLMRVLHEAAAPAKMPRTEKRRSWSGACTSTATSTATVESSSQQELLTFCLKRRSCRPPEETVPDRSVVAKKTPTRSYALDASDTTHTTVTESHTEDLPWDFLHHNSGAEDDSVCTRSTAGSRRDELRRTLSASSSRGRSHSARNLMMSNSSVNTAPLRALRKASSKTNLIEQAGQQHALHVFGSTDANNHHAKAVRRANRRSLSAGRRGLLSKSRSAYGRLTVGGSGDTSSSSSSSSSDDTDSSPPNRRSLLTHTNSQPQLWLPRQRSLRDLQESKEKAAVRPVLVTKQGSFTTQQSEIAALEALAGKKVPTRRTDLTRSHSCSAVVMVVDPPEPSVRRRTAQRSSSSKELLTLSPTTSSVTTSTPTTTTTRRTAPSTRRLPRGMQDSSSRSVTSTKSSHRRRRAKLLESKKTTTTTTTRKAHSMRQLQSSSSRSRRNDSSSRRSNSSGEEERLSRTYHHSPRMSLPNLPSMSHRSKNVNGTYTSTAA